MKMNKNENKSNKNIRKRKLKEYVLKQKNKINRMNK